VAALKEEAMKEASLVPLFPLGFGEGGTGLVNPGVEVVCDSEELGGVEVEFVDVLGDGGEVAKFAFREFKVFE